MGFFQDLKEDLSLAVNELIPEDTVEKDVEQQILEEDTSMEETMKEVEAALAEELEQKLDEGAPLKDEIEEALENALEEKVLQEPEKSLEEESVQEALAEEEEPALEALAEEEEPAQEALAEEENRTQEALAEEENRTQENITEEDKEEETNPIIDAAAAQIASIANIVAKDDMNNENEYEEREIQFPEELFSENNVTDAEETELEKEVGIAMADQKVNLEMEEVSDETAVITAGMSIMGDVSSKGSIDILGKVTGMVEALGKLNVSGTIEGDSKAAEVFADSAHITGKVVAEGTVKIGQNSVIIGDIEATSAVIAGAVKGDIDVRGPVILDASAIVMGNIKSKSVQINNGAVIEGMCSQCYAEVNPTSFFDGLIQK